MQSVLAGLIVLSALVYAGWVLLPVAGRRRLALRLLQWPPAARLGPLTASWRRAATAGGGCGGCDSCAAPAAPPSARRVIPIRPAVPPR